MKDRFSHQAKHYAEFRPQYPAELFEFIFSHIGKFETAWDAGTGNGQAARVLAKKFDKVYATDISEKQLENAARADNIFYQRGGETTQLPDQSVDLITVAQAIHWFDRETFFTEAKRVGKPGAVIAVWGYGLIGAGPLIDPMIENFYTSIVGPYWDPERKLIDQHYKNLEFPFSELQPSAFLMSFEWTLAELEGYLTTWSAVQKYIKDKGNNPVPELMGAIEPHWTSKRRTVHFPLFLRLGRIRK
ncbi:MAG: class I SAM-dependent methyltransferase [Cytophagales bacterium]|nr:class I SAM-dependent methyltransferase [Cytophagales bacterium]